MKRGCDAQGIVVVRLIAALRLPTEEVMFVRSANGNECVQPSNALINTLL